MATSREQLEFQTAFDQWRHGDSKQARARLEHLLARAPEHLEARLLLAEILLSQEQSTRAVVHLRQAAERHSDDPRVMYLLGLTLADHGQFDEALTCLETAYQLQPTNPVYLAAQSRVAAMRSVEPILPPPEASGDQMAAPLPPAPRTDRQVHAVAAELDASDNTATATPSTHPEQREPVRLNWRSPATRLEPHDQSLPPASTERAEPAVPVLILPGLPDAASTGNSAADQPGPADGAVSPSPTASVADDSNSVPVSTLLASKKPVAESASQTMSPPPRSADMPRTSLPTPNALPTLRRTIKAAAPVATDTARDQPSDASAAPSSTTDNSISDNGPAVGLIVPPTADRPKQVDPSPSDATASETVPTVPPTGETAEGNTLPLQIEPILPPLASDVSTPRSPGDAAAPSPTSVNEPVVPTTTTDAATNQLGRSSSVVPPTSDELFQQAHDMWRQKNAVESHRLLTQLLNANPEHLEAYLLLAEIHLDAGEVERALSEMRAAVDRHPRNPQAHFAMGLVLEAAGRSDEAQVWFARARAMVHRPSAAPARTSRHFAPTPSQRNPADKVTARPRPESLPDDASNPDQSLRLVGGLRSDQPSVVEQSAMITPAVSTSVPDPAMPAELLSHGIAEFGRGDAEAAAYALQQAVKMAPDDERVAARAAVEALKHEEFALSVTLAQNALRRHPRSAALWRTLGASLYRQQRFHESRAALERALTLDGQHALAHYLLGSSLQKLGNEPQAVEHFRRAAQLDPKYGP